jgi:peptidyl-prolyl cis-trans isomerase SurA
MKVLLLIAGLVACRAEIIDRVAVVVGNGVITESEILREIRLTAFLRGESADFSAAAKRKTAERLIEQRLIRDENKMSPYPPAPPEAVDQMLKDVQSKFPTPDRYREELARAGLSESDLKAHLERALTTLRFVDFRFRPGVQVSEAEIAKYFEQQVRPALQRSHPGQEILLADHRAEAESALVNKGVDQASDAWLKETRDHTHIVFRPQVFAPDPPLREAGK